MKLFETALFNTGKGCDLYVSTEEPGYLIFKIADRTARVETDEFMAALLLPSGQHLLSTTPKEETKSRIPATGNKTDSAHKEKED